MEDEGGLSFDFEGGLETTAAPLAPTTTPHSVVQATSSGQQANSAPSAIGGNGPQKVLPGRKNYRQTVCRHWLRGLCMKGDACGFLHQYDKARMPVCRFFAKFGECREPDCIYKHTNEDIKECNMYKLGFCPNGPDCRYRHQKMPGPPPSVEQNLQKIQHRVYAINGGGLNQGGKYSGPRQGPGSAQADGAPWPPVPSSAPMRTGGSMIPAEDSHVVHPPRQQRPTPQQPVITMQQTQPIQQHPLMNGSANIQNVSSAAIPLPQGFCRFFIVKSSNRENLELSVQRGLWATHRNNESKLNEAYDTCDHVILIFSVNETRHFQGCARMMSKIGGVVGGLGWKYAHGTAHYGRNFRLKWLKLCELTFNKTRHLRNPYNENLPVKISRDCQELEPSVGDQLASLLYMEPDSDLMVAAKEGEAKREEDKVRGGPTSGLEADDPDIIPFEDNDDEPEDDDSDDDDGSSQTLAPNPGRSRGPMAHGHWSPYGLNFDGMGRGGRGMGGGPGGRGVGFHPDMGDGFAMNFDRFGMPHGEGFGMGPGEMFGGHPVGPGRGFPPFSHPGSGFGGPDFPNMGPGSGMNFGPIDGPGHGPGIVFHGRPPPPNAMFAPNGPGMMGPPGGPMMMGGGARPPHFMGGPGPGGPMGRPPRPAGAFRPPFAGGMGRGGRGHMEQHKRRRAERAAANERANAGEEAKASSKLRIGAPPVEKDVQAESEVNFPGTQRKQGQDGGTSGTIAYTGNNEEDDSESEDEAPRRSRHGEGKKRRRDWDGEGNGGGSDRYDQEAEQGTQ